MGVAMSDPLVEATAITVLVVDDSPLMQRIITRLIESDPRIRVIDTASDGLEAIRKATERCPDVVTLDIEMPRLDGLGALKAIMERTPTPVIMLSAIDEADTVMQAMQLGAVEFVAKPSGTVSIDLYKVRDEIVNKIKLATFVTSHPISPSPSPRAPLELPLSASAGSSAPWYVAIGASTGGPRAIEAVLVALPRGLPLSVFIVQHMPIGFTRSFAQRLNRASSLKVVEAEDGMRVETSCAYVAPGGVHMTLVRNGKGVVVRLEASQPVNSVRPSIDVLMESVAEIGGARTLGVLLTGMGSDGVAGLARIKAVQGYTIAQDRESSTIFGMPRAAIRRGVVDGVLPLNQIADALVRVVMAPDARAADDSAEVEGSSGRS